MPKWNQLNYSFKFVWSGNAKIYVFITEILPSAWLSLVTRLPTQFFRENKKASNKPVIKKKKWNLDFRIKVSKIGEILINDSSIQWICLMRYVRYIFIFFNVCVRFLNLQQYNFNFKRQSKSPKELTFGLIKIFRIFDVVCILALNHVNIVIWHLFRRTIIRVRFWLDWWRCQGWGRILFLFSYKLRKYTDSEMKLSRT